MAKSKNAAVKANPAKDKKVTKVVKTVVPETAELSPENRNIKPGDVVETPVEVYEHEITATDLTENPSLVDDGVKVGDTVQIPVSEVTPENNAAPIADEITTELMAKMQPYITAYPTNKTFYITTDGQVFLEANKGDAKAHQRTLDGELVTFSVIQPAPEGL